MCYLQLGNQGLYRLIILDILKGLLLIYLYALVKVRLIHLSRNHHFLKEFKINGACSPL